MSTPCTSRFTMNSFEDITSSVGEPTTITVVKYLYHTLRISVNPVRNPPCFAVASATLGRLISNGINSRLCRVSFAPRDFFAACYVNPFLAFPASYRLSKENSTVRSEMNLVTNDKPRQWRGEARNHGRKAMEWLQIFLYVFSLFRSMASINMFLSTMR